MALSCRKPQPSRVAARLGRGSPFYSLGGRNEHCDEIGDTLKLLALLRALDLRHRYVIVGISAAVIVAWWLWPTAKPPETPGKLSSATLDVPVVLHTNGGQLWVATVTATEAFKFEAPSKTFLGVDLGKTVSQVHVKVVYRFHIDMAKEWPVRFKGSTAVVEAGTIKPTLPVAFDTSTIEVETKSGWGRFDKHENVYELQKQLTPEFERRSMGYKQLALPAARKTVGAFAKAWLAKSQSWKSLNITDIKVIFPGDPAMDDTTLRPQLDQ